jgi:hypothetical protein
LLKTVFGEEIKVDDEIMYIYKKYGDLAICFGKVLEIEHREVRYFPRGQTRLHVHKTYEIFGEETEVLDMNVILTNPTAFKCGVPIEHPKE